MNEGPAGSSRFAPMPLRFDESFERQEENEAETFAAIAQTLRSVSETTYADYSHAVRSVHAKCHGLLEGRMRVLEGLPAALAQGLFARPGTYPVVIRLSTSPGDILDDNVSTPRGLALKVKRIEGERLPDAREADAQDFLLVNGPAFVAPSAKQFLRSLKLLAATTDKAEGLKKAFSAVARGIEKIVESAGGKSATLLALGGQPETNILGETFYSQAPILYGDYMAKVSVAPVSTDLKALTDAPVDLDDKPNGLREAVVEFFATHDAEWELRIQLCTNRETMPIEDASVQWPEEESPYLPVARVTVPTQEAWNDARSPALDDSLSFTPWNGLAAHRPLGSIMRARKPAYRMSSDFRHERNAVDDPSPGRMDPSPGSL